jgi:hypothetical protein
MLPKSIDTFTSDDPEAAGKPLVEIVERQKVGVQDQER